MQWLKTDEWRGYPGSYTRLDLEVIIDQSGTSFNINITQSRNMHMQVAGSQHNKILISHNQMVEGKRLTGQVS